MLKALKPLPSLQLGDYAALMTLDLDGCVSLTALSERLGDCAALTTLTLPEWQTLTALPERIGDCTALATLDLLFGSRLIALHERLGDCAALMTLDISHCKILPIHIAVAERLTARGCEVLLGADIESHDEDDAGAYYWKQ